MNAEVKALDEAQLKSNANTLVETQANVKAEAKVQAESEKEANVQAENQAKQLREQFKQQHILEQKQQQSQDHLSKEQSLLISQSLPTQFLGHSVHTTVVSHPPTFLSHTPSAAVYTQAHPIPTLKNIHDNKPHLSIERTVHPQVVITQPPTATVQLPAINSPLTLLNAATYGKGLGGYSFISTTIPNNSNGDLLLNGNVRRASEQSLEVNPIAAVGILNEHGKDNDKVKTSENINNQSNQNIEVNANNKDNEEYFLNNDFESILNGHTTFELRNALLQQQQAKLLKSINAH